MQDAYETTSHVHKSSVSVTSPSNNGLVSESRPYGESHQAHCACPMASSTSSLLLMTIKMERSTCVTCRKQSMYAVDVVLLRLGTMRLRCVTTGLPSGLRGTECEDEESRAVRRNMLSVHLATGRLEFRPSFQPGPWESMACCHLLPFRWLVNCLNGNKWNKWIKSY